VITRVLAALDELVVNALTHGYPPDAPNALVSVTLMPSGERLVIELVDGGAPFDPLPSPAPDTGMGVEDRSIGGRGVHLVRQLVDCAGLPRALTGFVAIVRFSFLASGVAQDIASGHTLQ